MDISAMFQALEAAMGFVMIALASATPLMLAALGGLFSEKSGIVNIALEGKILFGAFIATTVTFWTGSPSIGCLAAMAGGMVLAMIHLYACQSLGADHIVSGAAINILAIGLTGFLVFQVFESTSSVQVVTIPSFDLSEQSVPVIGPVLRLLFNGMAPLFLLAVVFVVAAQWIMTRTPFGLRLRSIGENPDLAVARGINVTLTRILCLLISGALAGLAGAQLAVGDVGFFTEKMSAGRGFIALAAVIFGRWKPLPVALACLFFGFADAAAVRLKLYWQFVPDELARNIPFVLTLLVLLYSKAASGMPSALGRKTIGNEG
jgi:simple sugar transport system permease protein